MQTIFCDDPLRAELLAGLYKRPAAPAAVEKAVAEIMDDVQSNGDEAICRYLEKFDGVKLTPPEFLVSEAEIAEAELAVEPEMKQAITNALEHIRAFTLKTLPADWSFSPRPGVVQGERFLPMDRVGCYVPGGTAPLVSTSIHTVGIAAAAGVKEIVAATPPMKNGKVNPATLYALKAAGATEIYKLGGAYAVAALGYGTATIRKVEKLVGPGNAYVAAAKKRAYGSVAIDMVAGPSEIMVIADKDANPVFVAADMLSQAEHGSGLEQAVCVSDSREMLEAVKAEYLRQKESLTRQGPIDKVTEKGIFLIEAADMTEAAEIAGEYAPEHLEIQTAEPEKVAANVKAAGAIFLGAWTPEPAGDFTAGPSHVLPTAGTAKFFHGISGADFMRRSSIIKYTEEALLAEVDDILRFAGMEGLDAHGRSASVRRDRVIK